MLSAEGFEENRIRKIPSGKMLLERVGLTPCQGSVFSPSSRRADLFEGVSVIVPQEAKILLFVCIGGTQTPKTS